MLRQLRSVVAGGVGVVAALVIARRIGQRLDRAMSDSDDLSIHDWIDRAVADRLHGWWVSEVMDAFRYLETDFGYRLTNVHLHFRGTFLYYEGPTFDFVIEYDPDDTGSVHADLWVHDDHVSGVEHPRFCSVNDVLRVRDPGLQLPDSRRVHLDPAAVRSAVSVWATGLKELAPDVLRGAWPEGVQMGYLW